MDKFSPPIEQQIEILESNIDLTENITKQYRKYFETESECIVELKKNLEYLNKLAENKREPSKEAILTLIKAYDTINDERAQKIEGINIEPLRELLNIQKLILENFSEILDLKEDFEKVIKNLEKEKSKPSKKINQKKVLKREAEYRDVKREYEQELEKAEIAFNKYRIQELALLQKFLRNITKTEKKFHKNVFYEFNNVKQEIKVLESKINARIIEDSETGIKI